MPYQTKPGKLYIPMKKGDGELNPSKPENLRMIEGDCSGYIDPEEWDIHPCLSDFSQGETQWIEVDKTQQALNFAKTASKYVDGERPSPDYRRSTHYIQPEAIEPFLKNQDPDWLLNVREHKRFTPVLKLASIPTDSIKNYTDVFKPNGKLSRAIIPDVGQITTGTYTVGPAGGDNYPTFGGAGGFVAAIGANQTGDLRGVNTGNITETAAATTTHDRNGNSFYVTSDLNPLGNANNPNLISVNFSNNWLLPGEEGVGDSSYYSLLNIRRVVAALDNLRNLFIINAVLDAGNFFVFNNIFDGNSFVGNACRINDNTPISYFYDNIICCSNGGLETTALNANSVVENNSIYDTATGIDANNQNAIFRNNASLGNTTDFANIGNATGRNNADSDGTGANGNWNVGTGNQINLVAVAQWQSLVATDGDAFLLPVANSIIDQNGIAPTYATTLINGAVWGAVGNEIGAKGRLPVPTTGVTRQSKIAVTAGAIGVGL